MSYTPVKTDDGIEIRDGDEVIATFNTWPPRQSDEIENLFEDANVSQPMKGLLHILFGVAELKDEREKP